MHVIELSEQANAQKSPLGFKPRTFLLLGNILNDCGLWGRLYDLNHAGLHICVNMRKKKIIQRRNRHTCVLLSVMVTSLVVIDNLHMFFCTCDPFADGSNHLCIFPLTVRYSFPPVCRCATCETFYLE